MAERLAQCHTCDPSTAQHTVNSILLEAAKAHFPSQPRVDQRISARPDFQASAKYTWNLYAQMKATAKATLPAVRLKWRAAMRFRRASLALRAQSRQLKRQMLLDQMEQASEAADRGDQRTLHLLVRRLAPRSFRGVSRMPGSDGRLLTAPKELEAMVQCGHETFAALPDVDGLCVTDHNLLVTDAAIAVELGKLSLRKAAPCGVYAAPPSARFLGEPCDHTSAAMSLQQSTFRGTAYCGNSCFRPYKQTSLRYHNLPTPSKGEQQMPFSGACPLC